MEVTQKYSKTTRKCPRDHENGVLEWIFLGVENLQKYCTVCGEELIEVTDIVSSKEEICPNCEQATISQWIYCPWCGLISC